MSSVRIPSNLAVLRMANDIVRKQTELAEVQEMISSGKKVNRPSDAPVDSANIISMRETESRLDQYRRNVSAAETQLSQEEATLNSVSDALLRIRDLALSSNSGAVNDQTRRAVHAEISLRLEELYALANSRDSFGNYLFAGTDNQSRPFSPGQPPIYSGSDESHRIAIGPDRYLTTGDTGSDVFMRIRNGNGDFYVESDSANTGTGLIDIGSMTDNSLYDAAPYEIRFTATNSFDIVNTNDGSVVQGGVAYNDGADIEFSGIKTSISGAPQAGDVFRILPSENQDMFTTVNNFIAAMTRSPSGLADETRMRQDVASIVIDIDQSLEHLNRHRSRVGARMNIIESSRDEYDSMRLQIEKTRSKIEDVEIADAVTELQTRANALEILHKSYSRIEGLSLFDYM